MHLVKKCTKNLFKFFKRFDKVKFRIQIVYLSYKYCTVIFIENLACNFFINSQ